MTGNRTGRVPYRIAARGLMRTCAWACLWLWGFAMPVVAASAVNADDSFGAGSLALEDGLFDVAVRQFTAFLDSDNGTAEQNAEAALRLARALYEQGKFADILDLAKARRTWVRQAPDGGGFVYWRAVAQFKLGDEVRSLASVEELEKDHPRSDFVWRAQRLKAWNQLRRGDIDGAAEAFSRFDQGARDPREKAENLLEWSKALMAAGRPGDAGVTLRRLVKLPDELRAVQEGQLWHGEWLIEHGDRDAALLTLQALGENRKAFPDTSGQAYFALASAYENMTNFSLAVLALSNGIGRVRSPDLAQVGTTRLGHVWLKMGRLADGLPLIKNYVSAHSDRPDAADFQMEIAQALLDGGKSKEAADEFQLYLETFTNTIGLADAHMGRGWSLFNTGRYAESAAAFLRSFELAGSAEHKGRALFKTGDAYFANDQFELAADTFERFIREFPSSDLAPRAGLQLAESLARARKVVEGELVLARLAEKYFGRVEGEEALLRMARLREGEGKIQEAMESYGQLVSTYSNGMFAADAYVSRGILQYRRSQAADALKDFDHVIRRYASSEAAERAMFMKGLCHFRLVQDKEMLGVFRVFMARYPQSRWIPDVLFWLAKHEYNQQNYDVAEKQFLALADKYRDSPLADQALLKAGSAGMRRKEYVRAVEILARLAKEYPKSPWLVEARFVQAEAFSQLGKYADAIVLLDEIRNNFPTHPIVPSIWIRKGDCQFMLGSETPRRYEEAAKSYAVLASDPVVNRDQPELAFEAEYKIGKSLEKQEKIDDALDQYYSKVVVRFLREREKGMRHTETAKMWFTRAALDAADIIETRRDWRLVVNILERALDAGVPEGKTTLDRIRKIRNDYYWLFYGD